MIPSMLWKELQILGIFKKFLSMVIDVPTLRMMKCKRCSREMQHTNPRPPKNQLIDVCGEMLTEEIVDEIKDAKFFSILADEVSDCSNIEQMSVVIRFVDRTLTIREEFLGFFPCKLGLSGEAIANSIMKFVEKLGLNMEFCRGQGYDGAGNMAGRVSGAAARIQANNKNAIYVHCGSHILNLCIASSSQMQLVRNMMDNVHVTSELFNNSPKRFDLLRQKIKAMLPQARHCHLIDVCRTRWVSRIDGLGVFIEIYSAIVASLEEISNNVGGTWNVESRTKASGINHAIVTFQFAVCLIIISRCLEVTRPLTKQLQSP